MYILHLRLTTSQLLRNETEIAETRTLITKLVRIIIEGGTLTGMF